MTPADLARLKCAALVRRRLRCAKKARYVEDLGMPLCRNHEKNERQLRAVGYDTREEVASWTSRG